MKAFNTPSLNQHSTPEANLQKLHVRTSLKHHIQQRLLEKNMEAVCGAATLSNSNLTAYDGSLETLNSNTMSPEFLDNKSAPSDSGSRVYKKRNRSAREDEESCRKKRPYKRNEVSNDSISTIQQLDNNIMGSNSYDASTSGLPYSFYLLPPHVSMSPFDSPATLYEYPNHGSGSNEGLNINNFFMSNLNDPFGTGNLVSC
jgi:hypothetical protein